MTANGYLKSQPENEYRQQLRGGTGKFSQTLGDSDYVIHAEFCLSHDWVWFFTDLGHIFYKRGFDVPVASRGGKGRYIANYLDLAGSEAVTATLVVPTEGEADSYIVFVTQKGIIKKCSINDYMKPRKKAAPAIILQDEDRVVNVVKSCKEEDNLLMTTSWGRILRFKVKNIRCVGRNTKGVRGIRLKEGEIIMSAGTSPDDGKIITLTQHGYGKVSCIDEYTLRTKGGAPITGIKRTDKTGLVLGSYNLPDNNDALLITKQSKTIRLKMDEIRETGRITQGVRLLKLGDGDELSTMVLIPQEEAESDSVPAEADVSAEGDEQLTLL
jgi:DNA gyrase subunit A